MAENLLVLSIIFRFLFDNSLVNDSSKDHEQNFYFKEHRTISLNFKFLYSGPLILSKISISRLVNFHFIYLFFLIVQKPQLLLPILSKLSLSKSVIKLWSKIRITSVFPFLHHRPFIRKVVRKVVSQVIIAQNLYLYWVLAP